MLKVGEYTFEFPGYNINQSDISITLSWEDSAEALAQLFINNDFIFELDGVEYTEYDIIFSVTKHFGESEGLYTIILISSVTPQDSLKIILGRNAAAPYSQIVECRRQLEYMTRYLSIPELWNMSWMVADWAPGEVYAVGDVVVYNGQICKCAEPHTASEEFDNYKWLLPQDDEWVEYRWI